MAPTIASLADPPIDRAMSQVPEDGEPAPIEGIRISRASYVFDRNRHRRQAFAMRPEGFGMSILSIARVRLPSWKFRLAWPAVVVAAVLVAASLGAPERQGPPMSPKAGDAAFADRQPARPARRTAALRAPSTAPAAPQSRALLGLLILNGLAGRPFGPFK